MKTVHDYESLWRIHSPAVQCEAFRGVDVVRWHSQVERSLVDFIEKYEGARNAPYVDKLRVFLKQWRDNRLDGSINRETIELLLKPAEILAVDKWNLDRFFMGVRDGLYVLIASEEELPRLPAENSRPAPKAAGGRLSDFGPEKTASPAPLPGATKPENAPDLETAVGNAVSASAR